MTDGSKSIGIATKQMRLIRVFFGERLLPQHHVCELIRGDQTRNNVARHDFGADVERHEEDARSGFGGHQRGSVLLDAWAADQAGRASAYADDKPIVLRKKKKNMM